MFAVSETSLLCSALTIPVKIFIRTAIDFNCVVNRCTLTLLSASPSLSSPSTHSINRFFSCRLLFPALLFIFIVRINNSTSHAVFTLFAKKNALTAVTDATLAIDVERLFKCIKDWRDSVFILLEKNKKKRGWCEGN